MDSIVGERLPPNRPRSIPRPGQRVRGSTTRRPIMALLDLLGRRAALRVLRDLRGERLNFRGLVTAAATNPSVLNARLAELREAEIVEHDDVGYGLTTTGWALLEKLAPLNAWAQSWARCARYRGVRAARSHGRHWAAPVRRAPARHRSALMWSFRVPPSVGAGAECGSGATDLLFGVRRNLVPSSRADPRRAIP